MIACSIAHAKKNNKEEKLIDCLKKILIQQDLSKHQDLIRRISTELQISILDCAAALSLLYQSEFYAHEINKEKNIGFSNAIATNKSVKYRLDIGRNHQLKLEDLKTILVEVAGVERKRIGQIDIRNLYTLVDLPDGMPVDVFQLLSEVEINQKKLNIKRIKSKRRFYKRKKRFKIFYRC